MKHRGIYIYVFVLWVLFGLVYLYPGPATLAAEIAPYSVRSELDNYLISGVYTDWYRSVIVMLAGFFFLITGIARRSSILLNLSLLIGLVYTLYTTMLEVSIEQSNVALNHGVSAAVSGIGVILERQPDFVLKELLFFLFASCLATVIILKVKHLIVRETTRTPKRRRAR